MAGDFLAVCVANMGTVSVDWAIALRLLEMPVPFMVFSTKSIPIQQARNWLARRALDAGARWILFLDADVLLPPDGLKRLLNHQQPVVSALVGTKHGTSSVFLCDPQTGFHQPLTLDELPENALFSHSRLAVGLGCCLIDSQVFRSLPYPWFRWDYDPWEQPQGLSEDLLWSRDLRRHGIPIQVDVTVQCVHLGEATIDARGDRERLQFVWEMTGTERRSLWPIPDDDA